MSETAERGSIGWCDLTVEHGEQIQDSYAQVTGWKSEDHSMGQYSDYVMKTAHSDTAVAGVCHARGQNANLPPQWLPRPCQRRAGGDPSTINGLTPNSAVEINRIRGLLSAFGCWCRQQCRGTSASCQHLTTQIR